VDDAAGTDWNAPAGTEALIFDCDGTLADTMPVHLVSWQTMLARHGLTISEHQFFALAGVPTSMIIDQLGREQGVTLDTPTIAAMTAEKEDHYIAAADAVVPVAPVVAIAAKYRGVLPMAVASGGEHRIIDRSLGVLGIAEWFDAVVGYEDTERHKPDPDPFLEAARRCGAEPTRCVVFEDADLGIEAARRAGMTWVDVRRDLGPLR